MKLTAAAAVPKHIWADNGTGDVGGSVTMIKAKKTAILTNGGRKISPTGAALPTRAVSVNRTTYTARNASAAGSLFARWATIPPAAISTTITGDAHSRTDLRPQRQSPLSRERLQLPSYSAGDIGEVQRLQQETKFATIAACQRQQIRHQPGQPATLFDNVLQNVLVLADLPIWMPCKKLGVPRTMASGVRSSWEASAANARWRSNAVAIGRSVRPATKKPVPAARTRPVRPTPSARPVQYKSDA